MTDFLCLTFRFLTPLFHGRRDGGVPEWPPSPLRVMQALVATAGRIEGAAFDPHALTWIETLNPPTIVAPKVESTTGYRLSVPNNAMDLVAKAWVSGRDGNPSEHKAMKTVRPLRLMGEAVHYLWPLESNREHVNRLVELTRAVVALGWGVDHVVGDGQVLSPTDAEKLDGERYAPGEEEAGGLRVPCNGTLAALNVRHERFLVRTSLDGGAFNPPPPLSRFRVVRYRTGAKQSSLPHVVFSLLRPNSTAMRPFDAGRDLTRLAGMMRHLVTVAAERSGWPEDDVRSLVLGHGETRGASDHRPAATRRLAFWPIPTLEQGTRVGAIRRILVTSFGDDSLVKWAETLAGQPMIEERSKQAIAVLGATELNGVLARYAGNSRTWLSVTPVILPGHDDRGGLRKKLSSVRNDAPRQQQLLTKLNDRTEGLIRKALQQSGIDSAAANTATIDWSTTGFIAGVPRARDFRVPSHLEKSPRLHVRITFPAARAGPLCVGSGRFYGLGLLVQAT